MMKKEVQKALDDICKRDGSLDPRRVVEAARSKRSPLHSEFEWDDSAAAEAHRLNQARQLIRVAVTILPGPLRQEIRAYVSLSDERGKESGGSYYAVADVISDAERRRRAFTDARHVLEGLERRYAYLPELGHIFDVVRRMLREFDIDQEAA